MSHEARRKGSGGPRGFVIPELMMSLAIALALLMILTMSMAKVVHAQRQLAERRAGARRLEAALATMAGGGPAAADVAVERLAHAAPAGHVWVRVSEQVSEPGVKTRQSVIGLVPADKAPAGVEP